MNKKDEKLILKGGEKKTRVSHKFITALSIVSILGFLSIITRTFFNYDITLYSESLLMFIIGIGLVIEAKIEKIKSLKYGITSSNITHLTTLVIGSIAILAGIFSFPLLHFENPSFSAIKGILSIIAIIIIIIQTWVID